MYNTAQLKLDLAVPGTSARKAWAFAKDKRRNARGRRRQAIAAYKYCIITACSRDAKAVGIRVGMRYEEAKRLLPELRVLVIGGPRV